METVLREAKVTLSILYYNVNHNEITVTEESNHGGNALAILLTYFLRVIDV